MGVNIQQDSYFTVAMPFCNRFYWLSLFKQFSGVPVPDAMEG
jgi:hypothetical protein